jgi:protein-S-isoprenylcysteine O-methyltransferase Ste14
MTRSWAIVGSAAFLIMPGLVAGYVPWLLTGWRSPAASGGSPIDVAGRLIVLLGVVLLLECFAQFALQGLGTPSPVAPTRTLVIRGAYRFVRNPMYVAVITIILGQAILFSSWTLVAYALAVWGTTHAFVVLYEEPTLRETYGEQYLEYYRRVPRWLPRLFQPTP